MMPCLDEDQFAIRPMPRSFGFEPPRGSLCESAARKSIADGSAANRGAWPNSTTLGLCFTSPERGYYKKGGNQ